ncbi:unnamed protein product [Orchesella dallaii]|uniref:Uncharacterized protein n=1 Tax=Orchesella dallaii TaxID=48710 RepID=A0ABP1RPP6_9HEXA
MAVAQGARQSGKLMTLWKQGWNEIPEVMGASFYALIGIGLYGFSNYRYYKEERYNRRYKTRYTVYRPDDERVARIRKFEDSPQPTRTPAALAQLKGSC